MIRKALVILWSSLLYLWGNLSGASVVMAHRLDLASTPLFLTNKVPPNVILLFDDSGSMDWEAITTDAAHDGLFTGLQHDGTRLATHRDDDDNGRPDCGFGSTRTPGSGLQSAFGYAYNVEFPDNGDPSPDSRNCNTADDEEWRFRNVDANALYFNPELHYRPWVGVDAAGKPFRDMPVTAAMDNPYDPQSPTIDLTRHNSRGAPYTSSRKQAGVPDGFRYYTWHDKNGDGIFDDNEHTEHLIKNAPAAVQQNFANWFSYYRKRQYVAKAVYGNLLAYLTGVRVGLVTFFNNIDIHGKPLVPYSPNPTVTSINLPLQAIDLATRTPDPTLGIRRLMLDALYSFRPQQGTPLRLTLKHIGDYLENAQPGSRPLFPQDDAYLSEAQGGACQQSFVVLMTDGFESGAAPGVGNTDSATGSDGSTAFNGGPYADNFADTLGDVAMHYYQRDLRKTLADAVPTNQLDHASHQHMVTYAITFSGLTGSKDHDPAPTTPGTRFWPNPVGKRSTGPAKIDDVRHAAFNGRGLFLQANDVTTLSDALRRVLSNMTQRTAASAAVALNTGARSSTSRLFQARFDSADWSGQLLSLKIDPVTGAVLQNAQDALDAGALLDQRLQQAHYQTSVRTILTYKPSTAAGIPFQWSALDVAQQQALGTEPQSGSPDTQGQARLDYLRGSNAQEDKGFRVRTHRLGDIINSDPLFVGPPELPNEVEPHGANPSQPNAYAQFRDDPRQRHRMKLVMVGSNDGMFHIFNANDPVDPLTGYGDVHAGHEVLAYVPSMLLKPMVALTAPTYNLSHRYFVDGSPTAADVFLTGKGWRTVVVSGLGAGGQGYFALDITDPSSFQETPQAAQHIVLWEFSDLHDPDLGFAFSQPALARMASGQWAAIFGNGYNNTDQDGRVSPTGHAVFFVVFLDGPDAGGKWIEGRHYIKIDTGAGSPGTPNGLATPAAVDVDHDFTVDYLVAGDLEGNVWRVDVTSRHPNDWKRPQNLARLFVATDGQTPPTPQPITVRPEVGKHPDNLDGFVVYFGTGKYLEKTDNRVTVDGTPTGKSVPTQTFYGIWDKEQKGLPVERSSLLQQTVLDTSSTTDAQGKPRLTRVTSDRAIDWQRHRGFFLDLPAPGEKQVSDPVLRGERIIFSTLIPSAEVCSAGGTSFIFALDVHGGIRPREPFFDLNKDRTFGSADQISVKSQLMSASAIQAAVGIVKTPTLQVAGSTDTLYLSGSDGGTEKRDVSPGGPAGRQAWRRIAQ
jgi:type IV pilus assembly protein PilY1